MELTKSVSIIIPNYNGRRLLQEYLPFTFEVIKATGTVYEVIIVDDASKDGSVEFIRSEYPDVNLVVNPENKGFSYSYNQGIEIAKYELILLLNADVKLTPGYFDHQWKYFLRWDTFGVMGRIIDMDSDHIQEAARVPKFNGFKLKTDYFYYTNSESDRLYTFYLSGVIALINAEKLKQIGGFYELFSSFYYGDTELSLRAWRIKWKCYYEHQSICRHAVSASTQNDETKKRIKSVYFSNRFYLHAIHLNGLALIGWYFQIIIIDLLPKLIIGQTWILKSYRDLFKNKEVIKSYKAHIIKLMDENDARLPVSKVVVKIRASAKNKNKLRFKAKHN